jgi:hypothetical protein
MNLILPSNVERVVPDWFQARLKDTDPNLIVNWNRFHHRWVIDRCSRDGEFSSVPHTHDASCPRSNVMVVQDDNGHYMPLCDAVIDQIRSKDAWSLGSLTKFKAANLAKEQAYREAMDKAVRDMYSDAAKDDKRQLNQFVDLMKRHDVARPHK